MKRRKLSAVALCLTLILSLCAVTAMAVEDTTVSISYPSGKTVGDILEVTVGIENNPGVNAVDFALDYNRDTLKCIECEVGDAIKDMMAVTNPAHSKGAYVGAASLTAAKSDGELAVIKFEVMAEGSYDFRFIDLLLADKDGNELAYIVRNAEGNAAEPEKGDKPASPGIPQGAPAPEQNQTAEQLPFSDVAGHWALEYIIRSYDRKLLLGYGDDRFGPEDNVTRAQFATMLWRYCGTPEPDGKASFTDLDPKQDYYLKAVAWVEEEKIFKGVGDGKFDPDGYITREQIATVLHRLNGGGTGEEVMYGGIYDSGFTDSAAVSDWAKPSVYWAIYHELWCGRSSVETGSDLQAGLPATRAEIAVMVMKYDDNMGGTQ